MRTGIDVLRSVMDYAYEVMGEPWRVREQGEQGTFKRPAVMVTRTSPAAQSGGRQIIESAQGYQLNLLPVPGETVMASRILAETAEDTMLKGLRVGVGVGHPSRIPLWDYDGVPEDEDVRDVEGRPPRTALDYVRIIDLDSEVLQNPTDELLFTVKFDMRLTWRQPADVYEGEIIDALDVRIEYPDPAEL